MRDFDEPFVYKPSLTELLNYNGMNLLEKKKVASAKNPDKIKRPYKAPMLTDYGDIRQITQTAGHSGLSDSGQGHNHRTH